MIGFFEHQYVKYKKQHLRNLVAMAYVDGELHHKERNMLYTIGERYGLKGWQIAKIIENNAPAVIKKPAGENQRLDQIFDLVVMMLADNKVEEKEMNLCEMVTIEYGFKKDIIQSILNMIHDGKSSKFHWNNFKAENASDYLA